MNSFVTEYKLNLGRTSLLPIVWCNDREDVVKAGVWRELERVVRQEKKSSL